MADTVTVETRFYLDKIITQVNDANPVAAVALAHAVEGEAKMNIRDNKQIDTGFMVNSVFVVGKEESGYASAKQEAESQTTNKDGETIDHTGDMAPEPTLEGDALAGVGVGACYAVYQEEKKPFLFPAAETVAKNAGMTVQKVMNEMVKGEDGAWAATGKQVTQ